MVAVYQRCNTRVLYKGISGYVQGWFFFPPIPPVLFAIYIAGIHAAVEDQVEDSRGISFADDVTWLVEGRCCK